jgi:hypothetical protein
MGRTRDVSKILTSNTSILTLASASATYATKTSTGLNLIIPSTIANTGGSASIGTNGNVSFTSASAISLNGVFSEIYDVYLIQYAMTSSTNNGFTMRLRVGGSDDSTSSAYVYQLLNANTTTVSATRTTSNIWSMGGVNTDLVSSATIKLTNPFKTSATGLEARFLNPAAGAIVNDYTATHNQNTSYTGFSIIASTGNYTGNVNVYGYNK